MKNQIQIQFCKKYLKLPLCTFNAFALGECGRYPLYVDYFTNFIKHWLRLTRMNDTIVSQFPFDNIYSLAHVLNQLFLPNESSISQASYHTMVLTICYQLLKK